MKHFRKALSNSWVTTAILVLILWPLALILASKFEHNVGFKIILVIGLIPAPLGNWISKKFRVEDMSIKKTRN
ncbi:hypothetical protein AUQ39_09715 [Lacticaseibacillus casei]|jgi:uncharacterized membrane protein YeaQ/YmgE (transglycosylase-associated protein family)|nr:hypothetical protein AUQ39_09715 [Lacticaseibacillus casei]